MLYALFIWTVFFSSLSLFLRQEEIKQDVHLKQKRVGADRVVEVPGAYPVISITIIFGIMHIHISPWLFIPAYMVLGGVANIAIKKVFKFDFWAQNKTIIDLVSCVSGAVMLVVMAYYHF